MVAPILIRTDITSGSLVNGENGNGFPIRIAGKNFGTSGNLGTTSGLQVWLRDSSVGGDNVWHEVVSYRTLTAHRVTPSGMQEACVQLGALGGTQIAGHVLDLKVTVAGVDSNFFPSYFTVQPGHVWFVSTTGNDATGVVDDITHPFRYAQVWNGSGFPTGICASGKIAPGDMVIFLDGNYTADEKGYDAGLAGTNAVFRFATTGAWATGVGGGSAPTGAAGHGWIWFTAQPGANVHFTLSKGGGIQGVESSFASSSDGGHGQYIGVSGIHWEMTATSTRDGSGINGQNGARHWRAVSNECGPWPVATGTTNAAGVVGDFHESFIFDNDIHDISGNLTDKQNHGIYLGGAVGSSYDDASKNTLLEGNWLRRCVAGCAINLFWQNTLNTPTSIMTGLIVRGNFIDTTLKYGINAGQSCVGALIYNNQIANTGLNPLRHEGLAKLTGQADFALVFAFNTIYGWNTVGSINDAAYVSEGYANYGSIFVGHNIIAAASGRSTTNTYYANTAFGGADANVVVSQNNYWDFAGLLSGFAAKDSSPITANPNFTNRAAGDFTLASGSSAIDAVTTSEVGLTVTTDILGNLRPAGVRKDIGAFEFVASPPPPPPPMPAIIFPLSQFAACIAACFPAPPPPTPFVLYVIGQGVVGSPLYYVTVPTYGGTISGVQWRVATPGSAPVSATGSGNTSNPYTPVSGDVGTVPSIQVSVPGATYTSIEYSAANTVISQSGIQVLSAAPAVQTVRRLQSGATITVYEAQLYRLFSGVNVIDTVLSPGVYAASVLGNLTSVGGTTANTYYYPKQLMGAAPIITAVTPSAGTATRPGSNTGPGLFVKNGGLYDYTGKKFQMRMINRLHYDTASNGIWNTNANAHRFFTGADLAWTTNAALMNAMIAHSVVPMPAIPYCHTTATVSVTPNGNGTSTMHVTGVAFGYFFVGYNSGFAKGSIPAFVITDATATLDANGLGTTGDYTITGTITAASSTQTFSGVNSGSQYPGSILAVAQMYIDDFAHWSLYDKYSILCLGNENGAMASDSLHCTISGTTMTLTTGATPLFGVYNSGIWDDGAGHKFTVVRRLTGSGTAVGNTYLITPSLTVSTPTTFRNVSWREANIKAVANMRAVGFLGTLSVQSPLSGQDAVSGQPTGYAIVTDGPAIFNSDPQKNLLFDLHIYGNGKPGNIQTVAAYVRTMAVATGAHICFGEISAGLNVGANGGADPTLCDGRETAGAAEANDISWGVWAWDDMQGGARSNFWFNMVFEPVNGYLTGDPADLTTAGGIMVLDPVIGISHATAATFP